MQALSDQLTDYEKFETQIYAGPGVGEEIRVNLRSNYIEKYEYDFWLFDNKWIAKIIYEKNGTFVKFDFHKVTKGELEHFMHWQDIFNQSDSLSKFIADHHVA